MPNLTVSGRGPLPELRDWRTDHRPLTDEQRTQIATYVRAIVARDSLAAGPDAGHALAQGPVGVLPRDV